MISTKELEYVNAWPNKVPYPGTSYASEALDKLHHCVNLFMDNYEGKMFSLTRSDNTEIHFEILQKNICHMLGVDYKNLNSDYYKWYRVNVLGLNPNETLPSYEFLMTIFENFERVVEYDATNSYRALNYYKLAVKADIFSKFSNIERMDFHCINFDKEIFKNENNVSVSFNSNNLLCFPSDEMISPYYFLGLINNNDAESFVIETTFLPENFVNYIKGQEVTLPTQLLTNDDNILRKNINRPENKLKLMSDYVKLCSQYNLKYNMNISGDYAALLHEAVRNDYSRN